MESEVKHVNNKLDSARPLNKINKIINNQNEPEIKKKDTNTNIKEEEIRDLYAIITKEQKYWTCCAEK
jgi:Fic family protein